VSGRAFLVSGRVFLVSGTAFPVSGTAFPVSGTAFPVSGTGFRALAPVRSAATRHAWRARESRPELTPLSDRPAETLKWT
jgi:hypothetical protein